VKHARWLGVLLLVAATACATSGRSHLHATTTTSAPVEPERAEALLQSLRSSAAERQRLRGVASLSFDGAAGSVRSKQAIVVELPSHLRIEVLGFLSQAVAVLVTDGEHFELFRAEDRSRRNGAVYPGLLFEVAQIDLTPEEAAGLLLGAVPETPGLRIASAAGLDDGGVRLDLVDVDGTLRQRLDFDSVSRLQRVEAYAQGERLLWSAEFKDYQNLAGIDFAHEIELWFPSSQTQVGLVFKQVELNPTLPAGVFTLQLPAARAPASRTGAAG
jgi:hypothetical protein